METHETLGTTRAGLDRHHMAFHETMDMHELLNFNTVCMVNSKLMSGIVFDQDLKALLERNVERTMMVTEQLMNVYRTAPNLGDGGAIG